MLGLIKIDENCCDFLSSKSEMGNQKWGRQKNALILNPDFCTQENEGQ
jgi:hypothetical protein